MADDPRKEKKLPPGMVIGPNGKPCRACTAFKDFTGMQGGKRAMPNAGSKQAAKAGLAGATARGFAAPPFECPPDSEQLGRSTWSFLHTAAAYYPVDASPQHRQSMLSLLQSLPVLYPCSYCADHLKGEMQKNPPDVSGRAQLSKWLCDVHNEVNERLGKDKFDCSRTIERWKDGPKDGSCD